jgi:hypothetical protein
MKLFLVLTFGVVQFALAQPAVENPKSFFEPMTFKHSNSPRLSQTSVELSGKKSVATAALYSFLLPGMGEMYTDNYSMGRYFTIAEGTLWLTLLGIDRYAAWLQDDARSFAVQHAGITLNGKNDRYFIDIGNFDDVQSYNQQVLRDRDLQKLYNESSSSYWKWDSPANREEYRSLRVSSDQWFNSTRFVAAAIALNHLISAINAARLTIAYNKGTDRADLIDVHARVVGGIAHPEGIVVSFSKSF